MLRVMHLGVHGVSTFQQAGPDPQKGGQPHRCAATVNLFE
jgi:hypothetical protein